MAEEQTQDRSQAQYYDHMTLPGKGRVYLRDARLRQGREFAVSGDVESDPVSFDGSSDVNLVARIGRGKVGLDNISDDAVASSLSDSPEKLTTVQAVVDAIGTAKQHVIVMAPWVAASGAYVPQMPYRELRDFISRGFMPVLRAERDGHPVYMLDMTSDDGSTVSFRAPDTEVSSEASLPGGGTVRQSSTITTEFRYGPSGFSMVADEVKPAVFSVETLEI